MFYFDSISGIGQNLLYYSFHFYCFFFSHSGLLNSSNRILSLSTHSTYVNRLFIAENWHGVAFVHGTNAFDLGASIGFVSALGAGYPSGV
jgi:hypothetical protein